MFVNCSQNGQLRLYQNQCTFKKIHSLSTGARHYPFASASIATFTSASIHSQVLAYISSSASPSFVGEQLTALFHTQPLLKYLVKAQPSTPSTWPLSPTRLGIPPQDLGLPNEYTLGHCGSSVASRHKLASTSRHYSVLTTHSYMTRQHSTKLLCKKNVDLSLSSNFQPPHEGLHQATS